MNKLITTFLLAVSALALPLPRSFAQWQQTSGPGGGYTTALYAKGDILFAGNFEHFTLTNTDPNAGTLYRSTDHGQRWAPSNTGFTGVPLSFTNNDTSLFVATETDGIFRSMDEGGTWSTLSGTNSLSPVKLLYANGVLYVGSGVTGVYRSTDNGNTFVASSNGLPQRPRIGALVNIGATLFIGVSTDYPNPHGVYRSMDGGVNWQQVNNGLGAASVADLAVKGTTLFATTGGLADGGVYKSTNSGATWTSVNTGISGQPEALHVAGDGSLYVDVFAADYTGRSVYRSINDGASWSQTGPGMPTSEGVFAFASIGAEVYAGLGYYGSVYRTIDTGASWQPANIGLPEVDVNTIFPSGSNLFSGSLSNPGVHLSTDGGNTWLPSGNGLPYQFKSVQAFAQNSSYLFAAVDGAGTHRSSDNGANWEPANNGLTAFGVYMHSLGVNDNVVYAGTEDGVFKTTSNGTNWTIASPTVSGSRPQVQSVGVLGGSIFAGTAVNGIFKSSDAGATWTQSNNGIAAGVAIYSLTVRGTDLIAGTGSGVYLSSDNGASWSPRSSGLPAGQARTVAAQGNTFITAIYVPNVSRGVFISTNNGTSWSPYDGRIGLNAVRTLVVSGNSVYAGTETQSIWSSQLSAPLQLMSAVSRKTHGAAGQRDINLPLTGAAGIECRSDGTSGDHTLVITFSNTVVSGNAAVASGTGSVAGSPAFNGNAMMVSLTGVSDAQTIAVTLSNVTDTFGQTLPPTSVRMSVLLGDSTGNGVVNSSDVGQVKANAGATLSQTNFRSDVTANGSINSSDVGIVKAASGGGAQSKPER